MKRAKFLMVVMLMTSAQFIFAGKADKYVRSGVAAVKHLIETGDGSYSNFAGLNMQDTIEKALKNKTNWDRERAMHDDTVTGIIHDKTMTLNFEGANLSESDMMYVVLPGANFNKANLHKAHISEAWLKACNFTDTDLTCVCAIYAKFNHSRMKRSNCFKTNFRDASFEYADLSNIDALEARFIRAKLHNANCYQADFTQAILSKLQAEQTDFSEAIFYQAFLDQANLRQSKFSKANFDQAICDYARLYKADMRQANVRWASFKGAEFEATNLESIKGYQDADYRKCRMFQTNGHPEVLAWIAQQALKPAK